MQNIQSTRGRCPCCGKLLIVPMGNPQAHILMVGDYPGYQETKQGLPFTFRNPNSYKDNLRSGDILKDELTRVGIMFNQVLVTNLWQHEKGFKTETTFTKTGKAKEKKVEACPLAFHLDNLVKLFTGKTHVLMMGSEVTEAFLGVKVAGVSGTQVKIPEFPTVRFWASPNPALAFTQPIGELRLAFARFSEDVNRKVKTK